MAIAVSFKVFVDGDVVGGDGFAAIEGGVPAGDEWVAGGVEGDQRHAKVAGGLVVGGNLIEGGLVGAKALHSLVELGVVGGAGVDPILVIERLAAHLVHAIVGSEDVVPEKALDGVLLGAGIFGIMGSIGDVQKLLNLAGYETESGQPP